MTSDEIEGLALEQTKALCEQTKNILALSRKQSHLLRFALQRAWIDGILYQVKEDLDGYREATAQA